MSNERAQRPFQDAFDKVAALYDEMRPNYPPQLIADVLEFAELPDNGHILEIGSGTGKATLPFAQQGYPMLCIEPGATLAQLTRAKCADYPNVTVENTTYEEWLLQPSAFDLVICAEAFHWIAPEVQWPKTIATLKSGGAAANFWIGRPEIPSDFQQATDALFQATVPVFWSGRNTSFAQLEAETLTAFAEVKELTNVTLKRYPWQTHYTAEQYTKLLQTNAPIQNLAADIRRELLTQVYDIIQQQGGGLDCEHVSRLYLAKVQK